MTSQRDASVVEGIRGWDLARDFAQLLGRAFALAVAVGLLLTVAAIAVPAPIEEAAPPSSLRPEEATSGCFLIRRESAHPWASAHGLDRGPVPGVGRPGPGDRDPALPERDRRLRGGSLRVPPAGERRGRPPADAGRGAGHRGTDPRARAGACRVPAGGGLGSARQPRRAAAAQHLHQPRGERRARRGDRGRDRAAADAPLRRGRGAASIPAGGGPPIHSRSPRGLRRRWRRLVPRTPIGSPTPPTSHRRCDPRRRPSTTRCGSRSTSTPGSPWSGS